MCAVREQRPRASRPLGLRLAGLGLTLLLLPLTSCVSCFGGFDEDFGRSVVSAALSPYMDPLEFASEYTEHVWAEDLPEDKLREWQAKWYAEGSTIPELNDTRARITLPAGEDLAASDSPLRNMKVELNVEWYAASGQNFEGIMFDRVSQPGHMPVLKMTLPPDAEARDEATVETDGQPEFEYSVEYHHTIRVEIDELHFAFELWGTDPRTGEPAGERHIVKFRLLDPLDFDDADAKTRPADAPHFLVTSHTVEELRPDQGE